MIEVSNIKLVIWDLDDTFWNGTLSEGPIVVNRDNIQLVKDLTDRGIVNTICSKNDLERVEQKLQDIGVIDYFVFKSVDWTPKGERIHSLINDMGLRPVNCLFLDDNVVNLREAEFYNKGLMVAEPSRIDTLIEFCKKTPLSDVNHKRLKQYRVLEDKQRAKKEAGDNHLFLYSSKTIVEIYHDCAAVSDRLFELVNRTNQLNFTKFRCTREEFDSLLCDKEIDSGYVKVMDNFGDYGIVGFYAMKNNKLIHFLFSCRTIGQGVEQWVYSQLGYPRLEVVGDVVNLVDNTPAPAWINQKQGTDLNLARKQESGKIVMKGPCDMDIMVSYLAFDNITTEFTYISPTRFNSIEHQNHSINYLNAKSLSEEQKKSIIEECMFNDDNLYKTSIYDKDAKMIFLSTQIEPNLGIYQRKSDGVKVAFGEYCYPLTDEDNWENIVNGVIHNYSNKFTIEWLRWFRENYNFIGRISPHEYINNISHLLTQISPSAHVCLLLGSEIPYLKNTQKAYVNREQYYIELNNLLRVLAEREQRIHLINFTDFITGQKDFTNNINHYVRSIYYKAALKANDIITQVIGGGVSSKGKLPLFLDNIASYFHKLPFGQTKIYSLLRRIYYYLRNNL